jgi:two-component system chemotaxis sensor kinase CheA
MSQNSEFKEFFLHSARGHLQVFNEVILQLEGNPNQPELLQKLMYNSHSLKAESAGMGLKHLENLGNAIEDVFTSLSQGKVRLNEGIANRLFGAFDFIGKSLQSLEAENGEELDSQEVIKELKKAVILEATSSVRQLFQADASSPAGPAIEQIHSITLSVDKLDNLVKLGEELAIVRIGILSNPLAQSDPGLKEWVGQLDQVTTEFQNYIMRISLFPVSLALYTLPRLVRDTAQRTGKTVRLQVSGEEVTVDRFIIHHLTELLVHLVRNAIDHGIEPPDVRQQRGKNPEATVTITASIKEKHLYVDVEDDGAGIDWEALSAKAKEKGFYTTEEMSGWSEPERQSKLLFTNQLSTSGSVSEVSGRGVGLGAVSRAVQKLDGTLSVASKQGSGTIFTICLPVAMEVLEVLLVKINGRLYALPTDRLITTITVDIDAIFLTKEGPYLEMDGEKALLLDLAALLKVEGGQGERPAASGLTVALVRQAKQVLAILIDSEEGKEEVVVKPLESSLLQGKYFSGLTVLDNGTVVPIIRVASLQAGVPQPTQQPVA